jgi:anti-anti-sigma factor
VPGPTLWTCGAAVGRFVEGVGAMTLQVNEQVLGAVRIVSAAGELDGATACRLRAAVDRALDALPATVVVDLTAVSFIDSAGIRAVLDRRTVISTLDSRLQVVAATEQVRAVFELSGLLEGQPLHRTLAEALETDPAGLAQTG